MSSALVKLNRIYVRPDQVAAIHANGEEVILHLVGGLKLTVMHGQSEDSAIDIAEHYVGELAAAGYNEHIAALASTAVSDGGRPTRRP